MAVRRRTRFTVSWPLMIDPSTATPTTAPSSRNVLVVEAAMPEYLAGTDPRAAEVTGTMQMPTPTPAMNMHHPIWATPACGEMLAVVTRMPRARSTDAMAWGSLG